MKAERTLAIMLLLTGPVALRAADSWRTFDKENTPALPGNEIQFLVESRDNGLWIGTLSGAARAKNGVFETVQDADGKPLKGGVWAVLETTTGQTWIGTDKGLLDGDGRLVELFKGYTVAPIIESGPGRLWAIGKQRGGAASLFAYSDKQWQKIETAAHLRLTNLYGSPDGHIWITLDGDGVLEVDPATGFGQAVHHLKGFNVTTCMTDSRGVVWCGLWANGVASWDGNEWKRALTKAKSAAILSIVEDANTRLWVATSDSGLWQRPLRGGEWAVYLGDAGAINTLVATTDGRVWISGQNLPGLRYWSGTEWIVSMDSPLPIRTFMEAADGTRWAGGVLDGVHMLKK